MSGYTSGGESNRLSQSAFQQHYLTLTPINMLSSKEKRRIRRSAEKMEKRTTFESRGMDVTPFYAKTQSQEDLWKSLNQNTVTIAVGPAGVGKTLVALFLVTGQVKELQNTSKR